MSEGVSSSPDPVQEEPSVVAPSGPVVTNGETHTKSKSPPPPIPADPPVVVHKKEEEYNKEQVEEYKKNDMESVMREFLDYEEHLQPTDYIKDFYKIRVAQEAMRTHEDFACQVAMSAAHFIRNRYRDILPYDENRVVIEEVDKMDNPDGYVNASKIELPGGASKFIAAQAPLPTTLEDWWKMIDEYNITLVVMLCKLVEMSKIKCERYWPEVVGSSAIFGDYEITVEKEERFEGDDEYVLRTLRMDIPSKGTSRTVHQLHYREWPDHGCPAGEHQLLRMVERMDRLHTDKETPILVHCSAGVGRTGTIIAVNYIREMIQAGTLEELNLFELVLQLRRQRSSMVQTQDQYQFVHKCVAHYCKEKLGIPIPQEPKQSNGTLVSTCPTETAPKLIEISSDEEDATEIPDYPRESPAVIGGPEEIPS